MNSEQSQKIKRKCQTTQKVNGFPLCWISCCFFCSWGSVLVMECITLDGLQFFKCRFFLAFTPCFKDSRRVYGFGGSERFCCVFLIPQIAVSLRKILCLNVIEFLFVHSFRRIARKKNRGLFRLSWCVFS